MSVNRTAQSTARRLGHVQAETLVLACHGPLGIVTGRKPQIRALKRKGLIDDHLAPTDAGRAVYDALSTPLDWNEDRDDLTWMSFLGRRLQPGRWGVWSEDGRTVFVAGHGPRTPVQAVDASTIPDEILRALGLERPAEVAA